MRASGGAVSWAVLLAVAVACTPHVDSDDGIPANAADASLDSDPPSLVHDQNKYFDGLGEWVLIHKGPDGQWCRRADGRIQDCSDVRNEDAAAYAAKYGVMSIELATRVHAAPGDQVFAVTTFITVPVPPAVDSADPATREGGLSKLRADVAIAEKRWSDWIESHHGTVDSAGENILAAINFHLDGANLLLMSRLPGLDAILGWNPDGTGSGYSSIAGHARQ